MKLIAAIAVLAATLSSVNAQNFVAPTVGQHLCCASNQQRGNQRPELYWVRELDTSSQRHSDYQRSTGVMDHMEKPGTTTYALGGRLEAAGFKYSTAGENLGTGFDDVDSLTTAWMNSPGHRANVMGQGYTVCGGAVANPGGFYTINYAAPMSGYKPAMYKLNCQGSTSLGAQLVGSSPSPSPSPSPTTSAAPPIGHNAQTTAPAAAQSSAPAAQPEAEAVTTVVSTNANGNKVVTVVRVVSNSSNANSNAGTPPPVGHNAQEQTGNNSSNSGSPSGKCKRVPKGSIAAGKCKPCKKCGPKASPFRR
ncbi:hypothetical protein LPJ56_002413 [Coemansia sp. RSA 2599]|nr:hypothetical protein LPJ56_002413 [Coemansia sp. RSA 2599]